MARFAVKIARIEGAIPLTSDYKAAKGGQASEVEVRRVFGSWMNLWAPRDCCPRRR